MMRWVLLIGSGGAGKTTLATRIGARTGLPVIHLDAHYWQPGWVETPREAWEQTVDALCTREAWVMDGNYGGTLDRRLAASDTVIFLDLPRHVCLWRVVRRRLRFHRRTRPAMGPGCPERLSWAFVRWIWTYPRKRRPALRRKLDDLAGDKRVVTLASQADVERFVASLSEAADSPIPSSR